MNEENLVKIAKEKSIWDLGNKVLYDLCKNNPAHKTPEEIVAKIWLIGRSYAAAIERRKNKTEENDNFYEKILVEVIQNSELDKRLENIKSYTSVTAENLDELLEVHKYLTDTFQKITGMAKRSLASKYLHFHFPKLFFIYDSRANNSLRKLLPNKRIKLSNGNFDNEYAKFSKKMYILQTQIEEETKILLSPRELDNILIK